MPDSPPSLASDNGDYVASYSILNGEGVIRGPDENTSPSLAGPDQGCGRLSRGAEAARVGSLRVIVRSTSMPSRVRCPPPAQSTCRDSTRVAPPSPKCNSRAFCDW